MTKEQELENEYIDIVCSADIKDIKYILTCIKINLYLVIDKTIFENELYNKLFSINRQLKYNYDKNLKFIENSLSDEVVRRFITDKL